MPRVRDESRYVDARIVGVGPTRLGGAHTPGPRVLRHPSSRTPQPTSIFFFRLLSTPGPSIVSSRSLLPGPGPSAPLPGLLATLRAWSLHIWKAEVKSSKRDPNESPRCIVSSWEKHPTPATRLDLCRGPKAVVTRVGKIITQQKCWSDLVFHRTR